MQNIESYIVADVYEKFPTFSVDIGQTYADKHKGVTTIHIAH